MAEEPTIKKALHNCGKPDRNFDKFKQQMRTLKRKKERKNKAGGRESCSLAVILFCERHLEANNQGIYIL